MTTPLSPWTTHSQLVFIPPQINKGGFGTVYKARDAVDKCHYAIKQICIAKALPHLNYDVNLLLQEVELLQHINHPNIVRYHTSWLEGPDSQNILNDALRFPSSPSSTASIVSPNNFLFVQMELCDTTLKAVIERDEFDLAAEIPEMILQLCKALVAIHDMNIVHRDLKPDNIFLAKNLWKIGDFGLSRRIADQENSSDLLPVAGCVPYRCPDVGCSKKSDVYTLALVLAEVLYATVKGEKVAFNTKKVMEIVKCLDDKFSEECGIILEMLNHEREFRINSDLVYAKFKELYGKVPVQVECVDTGVEIEVKFSDFIVLSQGGEAISKLIFEKHHPVVEKWDRVLSIMKLKESKKIANLIDLKYDKQIIVSETMKVWITETGANATFARLVCIFKQCKFLALADHLATQVGHIRRRNKSNPVHDGIWFEVRKPVSNFTGRIQKLETIHSLILDTFFNPDCQQYIIIAGLGGVGKSDLVRKYAQDNYSFFDGNVIWITAENSLSMSTSFKKLATKLNPNFQSTDSKPISEYVDFVYNYFKDCAVLFIFDNANSLRDDDDGIFAFLPNNLPPDAIFPNIILTTRNRDIISSMDNSVKLLNLDVLEDRETHDFITNSLTTNPESHDVSKLGQTLENLPLALQQAVAYIREEHKIRQKLGTTFSISEYITLFQNMSQQLLDFPLPLNSTSNSYEKTTFITWKITFEKIGQHEIYGELAIYIMSLLAYLSPDSIWGSMIFEISKPYAEICQEAGVSKKKLPYADTEEDKTLLLHNVVGHTLYLIEQYSMCRFNQEYEIYIHRLVQHVMRLHIRKDGGEFHILDELLQYFKQKYKKHIAIVETNHAVSCWEHGLNSQNLDELLNKHSHLVHSISMDLSMCLLDIKSAIEFQENSIPKLQQVLGPVHDDVYNLKTSYAADLEVAGNFKAALTLRLEICNDFSAIFPASDWKRILPQLDLARTYTVLGKLDESHNILTELSEITKSSQSDTSDYCNIHTITQLQFSVGDNLEKKLQFDAAIAVYQNLLELLQKSTTEDVDLLMLNTKSKLAKVLRSKKKYPEAVTLCDEVTIKCTEKYGPFNPIGTGAKRMMAYIYQDQGDFFKASAIFRDVLLIERRKNETTLPAKPDNIATIRSGEYITWNNLAWAEMKLGNCKGGLEICDELLKALDTSFGEDSPTALLTQHTKAHASQEGGEFEQALSLHRKIFAKRVEMFGKRDYCTASSSFGIAMALRSLGKPREAMELLKGVLKIQQDQLGPLHLSTLETQTNIACTLPSCEVNKNVVVAKLTEICEFLQTAGALRNNHPLVLQAKHGLAESLRESGRVEESLKIYEEICTLSKQLMGADHPIVWTRVHNRNAIRAQITGENDAVDDLTVGNLSICEPVGNLNTVANHQHYN